MKEVKKKMEETLLEVEESILNDKNFRAVMDASPVMLWLTEKTFTVYLNKSWTDFTGRSLTNDLGRGWLDNVHPGDRERCDEVIPPAFRAQIPYQIEYRLGHISGDFRWVLEQGAPVFSRGGTFEGFVGGCVDIDKQKNLELALRLSEDRYRRLFETARDGILILDLQTGEITDVNPFLEQLLGYSRDEFLGKKLWEIGAFKNATEDKLAFKTLQNSGYIRYEYLPLETKEGKLIEVEFVSNTYVAGKGRAMQCNIRDISERKKLEAADRAMAFMEQEKIKSSFIADATHELRTPLAIIKGNVELALRGKKESPSMETLHAINVEVNHLAEMLSDLATLTTETQDAYRKIASHRLELPGLISRVVERCKKIALSKNISIEIKHNPSAEILGDRIYLEKLFSNIISNAIFYGKENGHVIIDGKKQGDHINISIKDDGIGIAQKDLPRIFERFYRTEDARIVNHEGTGLGLAICKWIVDAHGGDIRVASTPHQSTTFTITLPLAQ